MPELILGDFSGGVSRHGVHAPENTAAAISGARYKEGGLRETSTHLVSSTITLTNAPANLQILSAERVLGYTLVRCLRDTAGVLDQSFVAVVKDTGEWAPLYPRSNRYDQEVITYSNGYAYISPATGSSSTLDSCVRWDGVFPVKYTAANFSATIAVTHPYKGFTVPKSAGTPNVGQAVFLGKVVNGKDEYLPTRARIRTIVDGDSIGGETYENKWVLYTTVVTSMDTATFVQLSFVDRIGIPKYEGTFYKTGQTFKGRSVTSVALVGGSEGTGYNGGEPGTFYRVRLEPSGVGTYVKAATATVEIGEGGKVVSVIYDRDGHGYGYTTAPDTIAAGTGVDADGNPMEAGGSGCVLTSTLGDGAAYYATPAAQGNRYYSGGAAGNKYVTNIDLIAVTGGGSGADVEARIINGEVQATTLTLSGDDNGKLTHGGTGFAVGDYVTLEPKGSPASGNGALFVVTSRTMTTIKSLARAGGSGYGPAAQTIYSDVDLAYWAGATCTVVITGAGEMTTDFAFSSIVGGSGYINGMYAKIEAGGGTGMYGKLTVIDGVVTGVTAVGAGTGYTPGTYTEATLVPTEFRSATFNATVGAGGDVTDVSVVTAGTGYVHGMLMPLVIGAGDNCIVQVSTADSTTGEVTGLTIIDAGSGYATGSHTSQPLTLTVAGSGAKGTVTALGGRITDVQITEGGSGYVGIGPTRVVAGTGGIPATATGGQIHTRVIDGRVTGTAIQGRGSGYNNGAAGTFENVQLQSSDLGRNALATVVLATGGGVTSITLTSGGERYTTGPTTIVGGTGATAAGVAMAANAGGATDCTLISTLSEGYMEAGSWQYCARMLWKDLSTGAVLGSGMPSDPSITITTSKDDVLVLGITLSDWAAAFDVPWVANTIETYRRKVLGDDLYDPWYLLESRAIETNEIPDVHWERSVGFVGIADNGGTLTELLPSDAFRHERPGPMYQVREWNGRLLGVDGVSTSRVKFSTVGDWESWPEEVVDATDYTTELLWVGGSVQIGDDDVNNPIVGLVPEIGSYETTGVVGSAMLIFKHRDLYRWHGLNWSDFQVVSVAPVGCLAGKTVINTGGNIFWMGPRHMYAMQAGGFSPEIASRAYWPTGLANALSTGYWWSAALLGDTITLTGYAASAHFVTALNVEQGTFSDVTQSCWAVSVGPDSTGVDVLWGAGTAATYPVLYKFSSSVNAPASARISLAFKSRALAFGDIPEALARKKLIRRAWVGVTNLTGYTKKLDVSLYADGSATPTTVTVDIPYVAASPFQLVQVVFPQSIFCRVLQVGLTPTASDGTLVASVSSPEFQIHYVSLDYEHAESKRGA